MGVASRRTLSKFICTPLEVRRISSAAPSAGCVVPGLNVAVEVAKPPSVGVTLEPVASCVPPARNSMR